MNARIRIPFLTKRARTLVVTGVLALVVTLAMTGCGGTAESGAGLVEWPDSAGADVGPEIGRLAPNFALPTAAGATVTLAERTGSPLVLNFFASWCASCREELAILEQASRAGTVVIGVDLREKPEVVQALAAETGTTYPLALDRDGQVTRAYKVTSLPATFLLDEEGRVVTMVRGPLNEESFAALLAMADGTTGDA